MVLDGNRELEPRSMITTISSIDPFRLEPAGTLPKPAHPGEGRDPGQVGAGEEAGNQKVGEKW